jgi:Skp family chaperone for outer membrane proteins
MPDKLTDAEIVKALECCTTNGASCKDCPAFVKVDRSNCKKYFRGALDLINRLQAENENLQEKNLNLTSDLTSLQKDLTSAKAEIERLKKEVAYWETETKEARADIDQAVTEARKEFAERLISEHSFEYYGDKIVLEADIYKLLKEMESENNA